MLFEKRVGKDCIVDVRQGMVSYAEEGAKERLCPKGRSGKKVKGYVLSLRPCWARGGRVDIDVGKDRA